MTPPRTALAEVLARSRYLLFDFDGPICGIFSGLPAPTIAAHLRDLVTAEGVKITGVAATSGDPFDVLRYAATISPDLTQTVADGLRAVELRAVEVADATPHARQVIEAAHNDGRAIAAVSNNSRQAVARYLTTAGLAPLFTAIIGRTEPDPRLLKPDPHLIGQAVKELSAAPADCVLIGDSLSDIEAAHNAGTPSIGYANKPGKLERFTTVGADAVITDMAELIPHLTRRQPATD
ncbi:HAD family hydrolase [Actinoallomurus spadix]|uniref:HAD family hydrolase n=1 Tax=Actinoallomurus spadix TaxID=79912 RepID=A0ABN0WAI7_9ACTN|nr:HAD family hydrolase [Actinoallomurus spadix]MCO5988606.1 HAD family hydrolase [Actinoallomurus spadix]